MGAYRVPIPAFVPILPAAKKSKKKPDPVKKRKRKLRLRQLISMKELLQLVPLSRTEIWDRQRKGKFPRSVSIGRKSFWFADEIAEYQASLPIVKLKGDHPGEVEITERHSNGRFRRRDHDARRGSSVEGNDRHRQRAGSRARRRGA
jgi:predicted DNA-binding transcriptional regulator AlpA